MNDNDDILVIGDSCKDVFVYCDSERLCPDIPVPILNINHQCENEGMAKNVQRNIQQLIKNCDIITNNNWNEITKTRYVDDKTNHMFIRIDNNKSKIKRIDFKNLDISKYKIIVISDYNKGFLTEDDIEHICTFHPKVFVDTKKNIDTFIKNALYIKINNYEYEHSKLNITEEIENKLIITKGKDGCIFNKKVYPVKKVEIKDSSGAGDTFMAGLVCKYFETNNIKKAIKFANVCASKVVHERGVTII